MFINGIDKILDNSIDDFYEAVVLKGNLKNVFKITNFVEKQYDIMNILINYLKILNLDEIKKIVSDNKHIKLIEDLIFKYIFYYMFACIGYFYEGKIDNFKNNVIEISKTYEHKQKNIKNFFTSESNSNIFSITDDARIMSELYNRNKFIYNKGEKVEQKYENIYGFLRTFGDNFIKKFSDILSKQTNEIILAHNFIKLIIIQKLYITNDKVSISKILEENIESTEEAIYIDIVVPIEKHIDITDIESVLTPKDIDSGLAKKIYNIISGEEGEEPTHIQHIDDKIMTLINSGIVIPIVEDFLLYNKMNEKYDIHTDDKKKKNTSRIKFILNKINDMENYYTDEKKYSHLIYTPYANKMAIAVNELEEIKIISKLIHYSMGSGDQANNLNELLQYRQYPYINFKSFNKFGFSIIFDKTKQVVRYVSFQKTGIAHQRPHDNIQLRVGSNEQQINIIGFLLNSNKKVLECLKVDDLKLVENGLTEFTEHVNNFVLNGKRETIGWIFKDSDFTTIKTYEIEQFSDETKCKMLCSNLYDNIVNAIFQKIVQIFEKITYTSLYNAHEIVKLVLRATLNIPENSSTFHDLEKMIYEKIYEKYEPVYDKKEDSIFGLYGFTLKLPIIPIPTKENIVKIHLKHSKYKRPPDFEELEGGVVCQHIIYWNNILIFKKTGSSEYTDRL